MEIITMVVVRLSSTALIPKVSRVINQAKVGRWSALFHATDDMQQKTRRQLSAQYGTKLQPACKACHALQLP
jgi:hypothetical protein